jgi:dinuclear metal center YbgI/SA1388 family protein
MLTVADLVAALEAIAPTRYAESWDNVGLLVGDPEQALTRTMLTIDYTPEVADEATAAGCDAVVAYHPPIFKPLLSRVTATGGTGLVFDAIRRGIAIYSPHTALDVADGGTNDVLADAIGLVGRSPLKVLEGKPTQSKLVTFVPEDALERVSQAIFAAGAGRIGHYTSCSFRTRGTGTFYGEEGSNPTIGEAGRLEQTPEIKIETIVPMSKIDAVIRALRQSHPYEEPAFDLNLLAAAPEGVGIGRVGYLPQPMARRAVIDRIKRELGLNHLLVAGPLDGEVARAAVCAGACGDLLQQAITVKADLYLTGEMRHHDALRAAQAGITVVCTLHSNSERATLKRLAALLTERLPAIPVLLSQGDRDPFQIQ